MSEPLAHQRMPYDARHRMQVASSGGGFVATPRSSDARSKSIPIEDGDRAPILIPPTTASSSSADTRATSDELQCSTPITPSVQQLTTSRNDESERGKSAPSTESASQSASSSNRTTPRYRIRIQLIPMPPALTDMMVKHARFEAIRNISRKSHLSPTARTASQHTAGSTRTSRDGISFADKNDGDDDETDDVFLQQDSRHKEGANAPRPRASRARARITTL